MRERTSIREQDVRQMLELMGQLTELPSTVQRLEHAVKGICQMVGADFAFATRYRSDRPDSKVQPYAIVSHGWTGDELARGIDVASVDPFHDYVNQDMYRGGAKTAWPFVFVTQRMSDQRKRERADTAALFQEQTGGDIGMAVIYPCGIDGHYTALGLLRQGGPPVFDQREIAIARLTWEALKVLHTSPLAAIEQRLWGNNLPPRLTQVLEALKEGLSAKQIAYRLDISVHTVNDYIKDLYRRFGVSGRSELLALWIHQQHQQHEP